VNKLLAILMSLILATTLTAKDLGVYAQTYPIAEMDIIKLIYLKLNQKKENGELKKLEEDFKSNVKKQVLNPVGINLLTTNTPHIYSYTPSTTIQKDIYTPDGVLLYPKGFKVNPLDIDSYPKSIRKDIIPIVYTTQLIFINAQDNRQVNWLNKKLKQLDKKGLTYKIILLDGNIKEAFSYFNKRIYFDQGGKIVNRMGIKHVPTIAYQKNNHFNLQEYNVEHFSRSKR
jgi:type-F conjugative transfer system protein TraW